MIEHAAARLARSIKEASPEKTVSVEVLKYGLTVVFNYALTLCLCLLVGAATGHLRDVAVAYFAFVALRSVSGGYHLRSALACVVTSTLIVVVPPMVPLEAQAVFVLNALNCLLMLLFAPSRMEKSNISKPYYPMLKLAATFLVSANFYIQSDLLALIFFIQSVTLVRLPRERGRNE